MSELHGSVVTNGGPLIALPRELADAWLGTGPDGTVGSDYDRACDPPERIFAIDDALGTWPISVGHGAALVLEGESTTTAYRWDDGVVIARDAGSASDAELLGAIETEHAWKDCAFELTISRGLVIFDAAYPGLERDQADGGTLDADLRAGTYRVLLAYPRLGSRTTFVRLAGPREGPRGTQGIVIR